MVEFKKECCQLLRRVTVCHAHYCLAINFNSLMFELHCKFINQWMLDSVQHLAFSFRISAGNTCSAIHARLSSPRSVKHRNRNIPLYAEADAAWFHHLTRKQIIIDKYCTKLTQSCGYRAFASRYAAGQSYSNHHNRHCNALRMRACHAHTKKTPNLNQERGLF